MHWASRHSVQGVRSVALGVKALVVFGLPVAFRDEGVHCFVASVALCLSCPVSRLSFYSRPGCGGRSVCCRFINYESHRFCPDRLSCLIAYDATTATATATTTTTMLQPLLSMAEIRGPLPWGLIPLRVYITNRFQ